MGDAGARIIKLAYEVGTDFIRHTLPAGLARSTPPYGTLVIYDVPESPFGPYRMAAQTLACRYRNFARVYVLQAVVDNPVALAALREVWSYPAAPGTVELADDERSVGGLVSAPDGSPLARFTMTDIQGAEAERVVLDGELTARVPPRFSTGEAEPSGSSRSTGPSPCATRAGPGSRSSSARRGTFTPGERCP